MKRATWTPLGRGGISGWARNGATAINVDIYDGTVYLTTVFADLNTGSDSYYDGSYYGFSLALPAALQDNTSPQRSTPRYRGTTTNLGSDPRTSDAMRRPPVISITIRTRSKASVPRTGPKTEPSACCWAGA